MVGSAWSLRTKPNLQTLRKCKVLRIPFQRSLQRGCLEPSNESCSGIGSVFRLQALEPPASLLSIASEARASSIPSRKMLGILVTMLGTIRMVVPRGTRPASWNVTKPPFSLAALRAFAFTSTVHLDVEGGSAPEMIQCLQQKDQVPEGTCQQGTREAVPRIGNRFATNARSAVVAWKSQVGNAEKVPTPECSSHRPANLFLSHASTKRVW